MRTLIPRLFGLPIALCTVIVAAQTTSNPIQAPITKRGLQVEIKDLVRLPDTRKMRPVDQDVTPSGWARISFVRDLPDGRRFVNDSRGVLYVLDSNNQPQAGAPAARTLRGGVRAPGGDHVDDS